jgi:isopentenyl phosphate kinase
MTTTDQTAALRIELAQNTLTLQLIERGTPPATAAAIAKQGVYVTHGDDVVIDYPNHRAIASQDDTVGRLATHLHQNPPKVALPPNAVAPVYDPIADGKAAAAAQKKIGAPDSIAFR